MDDLKYNLIEELSKLTGIVSEYWDIFGKKYIASIESKGKILSAMGFNINFPESIIEEIKRLKKLPWTRFIDNVYVVDEQPFVIHVFLNLEREKEQSLKVTWRLASTNPNGLRVKYEAVHLNIVEERFIDSKRYIKIALPFSLPKGIERFDLGYYDLTVNAQIGEDIISARSKVIICPKECYLPPEIEEKKLWGLSVNLYSLKSSNNMGIGDLGDLTYCIQEVKKAGGSFVGINPLHAITNQRPYGISPYSPISKFYRNFIYINLKEVEGFDEDKLSRDLQKRIKEIIKDQYINYEAIAEIKLIILKELFDLFYKNEYNKKTPLAQEFNDFIIKEGEHLINFALYCAIADHEGKKANKPLYSWRQWDMKFHSPFSEGSLEFKKRHIKTVLFYCYLQWLIERQFKEIIKTSHPMPIGIYNDLAVGSIRDGSDEWVYQEVFVSDVNAGAPPDDFNTEGQDWGFPPLSPIKLRESAYEPLIWSLKKNMNNAGALRIDHALGLFRMFWVPLGSKASEGIYVEYPYEEILKIIALESHLNKTIIIAEDLGTVTDRAREALSRYKMLSYRLLYFQRKYPDPAFVLPEEYPPLALCTVTTHDLPTIKGFWQGIDINLRKDLSFFKNDQDYQLLLRERQRDKELLLKVISHLGIIDFDLQREIDLSLIHAIYEFLAKSKSMLLAVNLDDLMETTNQQNMPGTVEEYPCWKQKTPKFIEEFFREKTLTQISEIFKRNNRVYFHND